MTTINPTDAPTVSHDSREVPVAYDVDVAVLGAGAAGVAAACAAAEEGAETLLLDRNGYFGGTSTGGGIATFCGFFDCARGGDPEKIVAGFGDRVLDGLDERDALEGPTELRNRTNIYVYDPEVLKLVYDDLVAEAGVEPLLHAHVSDAIVADTDAGAGDAAVEADDTDSLVDDTDGNGDSDPLPAVEALVAETPDGPLAVRARRFVDASGDGYLAAAAGAEVMHVPEESQSSTTLFFLGGVHEDAARANRMGEVRERMVAANERGEYDLPKTDGVYLVVEGRRKAWINFTDLPGDAIDPGVRTAAEIEGRRQAEKYLRYFRNEVDGFEDAYLDHFAAQLGIRETRKVVGEYVLTYDDFAAGRRFDDAVAHCGWAREVHDPETRSSEWEWLPDGGHYDVPFRSLVVRDLANVAVAGRCASAEPSVQASMRVIGTAYATGEAAGTAVASSVAEGRPLRDVSADDLQETLRRRGAYLDVASRTE